MMKDFYTAFYAAIEHSPAHHVFCERVFGIDLSQHGFADIEQLGFLIDVAQPKPGWRVLDLGCGNGMIAEYLSDRTGAHVAGLDYIPLAIAQAQRRTASKADRLSFQTGDLNQLELPQGTFDLILSIDSIYFSDNYTNTVLNLKGALQPEGQMAFFYSYGREPWIPVEKFPRELLPPDRTPLAAALQANGLAYRTWDLTEQDYQLAIRRKKVLEELKPRFESEGIMFIYANRMGDAEGVRQAIEEGLHARYLYIVE